MEPKATIFDLIKSIIIQCETEIATDQFQTNETNQKDYYDHLEIINDIRISKNWDEFLKTMDKNYSMGIEDIISIYCKF